MSKLRTAVIGAGYLGKFHAEKYAQLPTSELVAVCDLNLARATDVATPLHTRAIDDYRTLIGQVDAVSIVTPTADHATTAAFFLEHGVHVLVEKPITLSTHAADQLIQLARQHHVLLQVGHLERFNPCITAARPLLKQPCTLDARREAPFKIRGTDVNVVLDMMIHDLDLVLMLVPSRLRHITAHGTSVLSDSLDVAHTRLEFENGCIATLSASRVSEQVARHLNVATAERYVQLDLQRKTASHTAFGGNTTALAVPTHDALYEQLHAFLNSIQQQQPVQADGEAGKQALSLALQISALAAHHHAKTVAPLTLE